MKIIGTFFNTELEINEKVYLIAPTMDAAKSFMKTELKNFSAMYEDIPYDEWKKTHPDRNMVDFYETNDFYNYCLNCKYSIVVIFNEADFDSANAIEIDINGGRV